MDNIRLFESVSEETTVDAPYVFALKDDTYVPSTTAVTSATISADEKVTENKTATLRWMKHVVDEGTSERFDAMLEISKFSTFKVDGVEQVPQNQTIKTKSIVYNRQELSVTYDEDNDIFTINGDFDENLLFNDGDGYQFSFEDLTMAKGVYGSGIVANVLAAIIVKVEEDDDERLKETFPIGLSAMVAPFEIAKLIVLEISLISLSKYTIVKLEETYDDLQQQESPSITILPQKVTCTNDGDFILYTFPSAKEYYIEFDYKQGVTEVNNLMFRNQYIAKTQGTMPFNTLTELSDNALDGITIIGGNAFEECSLTSVTISSSVTSIGYRAFAWCYNLVSVTYNGITYSSKSALEAALADNGVSVIDGAFDNTGLSN